MDNIDLDKAARYRAEALGVPADLIPTMKDIQQRRQSREVMRQQQAQEQISNEVQLEAGKQAAQQGL